MKPGSVVRCERCGVVNKLPLARPLRGEVIVCRSCGKVFVEHAPGLFERLRRALGFREVPYVTRALSPDPAAPQPPPRTFTQPAPTIGFATRAPEPHRPPPAADPLAGADEILGLSAEQLRARAMKINVWRTAWFGATNMIPPQSDERTALIDRGLILRGLLTSEQIREIHRVGDLWLRYRHVATYAALHAAKAADETIEAQRRERKERKAEKKRLAEEGRQKRAEDVARRRREDIIFAGSGVSSGLADRRANVELLQGNGLPLLATPLDLANALGITISELRWLSFHAEAMERMHYVNFEIAKRSGGTRVISAPHAKLAKAQEWILANVLEKLPTEAPAHGFVKLHSTVTNARPHINRPLVVNLDLEQFFPSITFPRVKGLFRRRGYSPAVATLLALLCTESPRRAVTYDGKQYWVAVGERALPQGACTSPAISNQIARRLDRRLTGMAAKHGWTYTRYADDLTFSGGGNVGFLMASVRHIVQEEGFALHPKKGRVQRRGGRQTVTGIVVNKKLGVPREEVRQLRAILHGARTTGLAAQNRTHIPDFERWLRGKIAYVHMVDPAKGDRLLAALDAL